MRRCWLVAGVLLLLGAALAGCFVARPAETAPPGASWTHAVDEFPLIAPTGLDPGQLRLVDILRREHAAREPATKYSSGVPEPWCADFISWNLRAAGMPLVNPNSGGWRIPGTRTLADYYRSAGRFRTPDSGHQPTVGDVVFYSAQSPFGQHASMVLANEGGELTTIGGNEGDQVRVRRVSIGRTAGVLGFGLLPRT
ncbi:CHAP domain-containing protein [Pseudonocardia spinosispora]|uniref:CHAP domain-containing protein n=1 Tax=Pseudonocardia spinosispora TaxID=103441 RepID=UPI000413B52C|nr:CHAP domain-containing protein [Pseudonocardia spinosispora]